MKCPNAKAPLISFQVKPARGFYIRNFHPIITHMIFGYLMDDKLNLWEDSLQPRHARFKKI